MTIGWKNYIFSRKTNFLVLLFQGLIQNCLQPYQITNPFCCSANTKIGSFLNQYVDRIQRVSQNILLFILFYKYVYTLLVFSVLFNNNCLMLLNKGFEKYLSLIPVYIEVKTAEELCEILGQLLTKMELLRKWRCTSNDKLKFFYRMETQKK